MGTTEDTEVIESSKPNAVRIEICHVYVGHSEYCRDAQASAQGFHPGPAWKYEDWPQQSTTVNKNTESIGFGLSSWVYSFWREVEEG